MDALSRRERQILDVIYSRGRATAAEIRAAIADPPGYSAIRALLRILEQKGHVRHEVDGIRYVFLPRVSRQRAHRCDAAPALCRRSSTAPPAQAATALVDGSAARLSPEELDQLEALIERARKERTS